MNFNSKARYVFLAIQFFTASVAAIAQNSNRTYQSFNKSDTLLEVVVSDGIYLFKVYSEEIMETSFIPTGETFNPESHAVVLTPSNIAKQLSETKSTISYSTTGISVVIQKNPFKISYFYNDKYLVSEKEGFSMNQTHKLLNFNLNSKEIIYGGGERVIGMNHRGYRLQLYNRAHYGYTTHSELMNYTMPLVLSSKIYALHFDNAPIGYLDIDSKKDNTLTYETISGRMTYQIVASGNWPQLMNAYTSLTGKQPMIPRWALGNFSSRFGYHTEKETRETVDKFIENEIPLDAVIIDIYWFGADIKGHMGNLEFLTDSFPTPNKMIADFKAKGVKTILVTEPFILTTSKKWDEATEQNVLGVDSLGNPYTYDFYFGNTGLVDIFKPEGKNWFWNIYMKYTEQGVGGWWGDLGEPEVHPSDLQHATGSADEVHNIYGHQWAKLIFEGYQQNFPEQRPFILMRSGYSGSQHYGLIPWSGDVSRSWGGLQPQPEIALQMGIQGIGYMHSDLGGFAGGEEFDAELYTRWLQYGVFQPIYRPHAQEHIAPEPVYHDENTMSLAKQAIELRYKLMPYNYNLVFENNQLGMPLMRPLFFEEQENELVNQISDTYLWGDAFLVSPVLKQGLTSLEVYFPSNNNWFDFYSGEKHIGGTNQEVNLASDHIPVFVRAGAFVPMVKPTQSTKDYSTSNLDLHFYYDKSVTSSSGSMYNDDGETPNAFEKQNYELLKFSSRFHNEKLELEFTSVTGSNYKALDRTINLIIHNVVTRPKRVDFGGQKIESDWNKENESLTISFQWTIDTEPKIEVDL